MTKIAQIDITCQNGDVIHAFPCGTLALDFVGTLRARRNETPTELLTTASNLDAWFRESALLPDGTDVTDDGLSEAIALREAIYALAWARLHDRPLPPEALDTVNRFADTEPLKLVLTDDGWHRHGTTEQALSQLARETIELMGGDEARLLRECGRPECTQVYLDHSRGHRREWCSMATCGSRMKAKAYRERRKVAAAA